MKKTNGLHSNLMLIQGKDELIYTQDEATELNDLLDKAKMFYTRSKEEEKTQNTLLKNIAKLQGLILEYATAIDSVLMFDEELSTKKIEKLKKEFVSIQILEKQVNETFYEFDRK